MSSFLVLDPSGEEDLREREEAAGWRSLPRPAGSRLPEELQHVHLPRPLAVRPAGPAPRRRVRRRELAFTDRKTL